MIYRVTARFLQAFDKLDSKSQALVRKTLLGFASSPRAPTRDCYPIQDTRIWALPCGGERNIHITYCFLNEAQEPDHFICVLRHVGITDIQT